MWLQKLRILMAMTNITPETSKKLKFYLDARS